MSQKLYSLVAQVMNIPISKIDDKSNPETIETWDSFHLLVLIDELETTFDIKFTLEEVVNIKSLEDIKSHLQNHGVVIDAAEQSGWK
jgi:acyl carrier protein